MKIYFLIFFFGLCGVIIFTGCDDTVKSPDQEPEIPASNVSYGKYIQPLFDNHCNFSGCHDDGSREGGISLTSYANLNSANIIFIGFPESSRLYQVIIPGAVNFMPPVNSPYVPLTKNQMQGIYTWIKEGAKPN